MELVLEDVKRQLMKWLGELRYTSYKEEDCIYVDKSNAKVRMMLYTNDHSYSIMAIPPGVRGLGDDGYLGCMSSSRKPRTGEDWKRGNDLADGSFCYETWIKIVRDIVGYELVKIQRPISLMYQDQGPKDKKHESE